MKTKLLVSASFVALFCTSVFSQDLNTTKTVKEKPVQTLEKGESQAQPISSRKNTQLNSAKSEAQVLERKEMKKQPAKSDL